MSDATGPGLVYVLCLLTSLVCTGLLVRAWLRSRSKLLLWSAISFSLLALNNVFVVIDVVITPPDESWLWARQIAALAAVCVLLYAFIWEVE